VNANIDASRRAAETQRGQTFVSINSELMTVAELAAQYPALSKHNGWPELLNRACSRQGKPAQQEL
jgi:hypothetical protein